MTLNTKRRQYYHNINREQNQYSHSHHQSYISIDAYHSPTMGHDLKHKLLFTGNLVRSSAPDSSKQNIQFPLFEEQGPNNTTANIQKSLVPIHNNCNIAQDPSFHAIGEKHSSSASAIHVPAPRPQIMPRTKTLNRASISSKIGISSSPGNKASMNKSSFSAFSSPMQRHFLSKNVSPVPSVITSEGSESTFGTPILNHSKSYNENVDFFLGVHGRSSDSSVENRPFRLSASPQTSKPPHFDQYYFTPVHKDADESNPTSCHINEAPRQVEYCARPSERLMSSFPQCTDTPHSIMYGNGARNGQMHYEYTSYSYQQVTPSTHFAHYCNAQPNIPSPQYCRLVAESPELASRTFLKSSKTFDTSSIIGTIMKCHIVESPVRPRKRSIDSFDSSLPSDESSSCASPLPQNLKGDPHRQAKVKTELCLHYARGKECPFGFRCNYAHGEDELKYTKLVELKEAGLVEDVSIYRTHPCASWVATGACPFGLRCHNIHDPRIASETASWLPHSDIPVNVLSTDLVVDKSFHYHLSTLNQQNLLVHNLIWNYRPSIKNLSTKMVDKIQNNDKLAQVNWRDTYSLVCNMVDLYTTKKSPNRCLGDKGIKISELEKLCMVFSMSYVSKPIHMDYVYKPKYMVYGELCMVLQTKYFLLLRPSDLNIDDSKSFESIVREISLEEYQGRKSEGNKQFPYCPDDVVVVKELAFGCLGETTSKVSLWFDLPEPVILSNQEIKRHKRNRQRKLLENNSRDAMFKPSPFPGSRIISNVKESINFSFESHYHKPFFHMRPFGNDPAAFHLICSMLKHRASVLLLRKDSKAHDKAQIQKSILKEESRLQLQYQNLTKNMNEWKWPASKGRQEVSIDTSVPSCSVQYEPSKLSIASALWEGFLKTTSSLKRHQKIDQSRGLNNSRLLVFKHLSKGVSLKALTSDKLIHIKAYKNEHKNLNDNSWKTILGIQSWGGWNLIQEHYLGPNETKTKDKSMPLSPSHEEK